MANSENVKYIKDKVYILHMLNGISHKTPVTARKTLACT